MTQDHDRSMLEQVDVICAGYLDALEQGTPKPIEVFLEGAARELREDLFRELLALELELRADAGEQPAIEEYETRFSEFSAVVEIVFEEHRDAAAPALGTDTSTPGAACEDTAIAVPFLKQGQQFGRYRILRPLGRGAMGAVFLAHDPQLDRKIALKIPFFLGPETKTLLERFNREVKSAATFAACQHLPGFSTPVSRKVCPI